MRESPDVVVIGEMRDFSTMQTAITAALTGHLVISTVHTSDTVQCAERIINNFPDYLRKQASLDLSLALRGIIAQRLVPLKHAAGLIPAIETLKATQIVKNLVAGANYKELEEVLKRGREEGMVTFTRALSDLYKAGKITLETGAAAATNREEFILLTQGMESGVDTFIAGRTGDGASEAEINMRRLLYSSVVNGASDLVLSAGTPPTVRFNGELTQMDTPPLTANDTKRLLFSVLTPRQRAIFEENREIDLALAVSSADFDKSGKGEAKEFRFRVNGFYQRGNVGAAIRVIPTVIPAPESLGLPGALISLADKKQGLILVTGPTGHGKSTTLASMIDRVNSNRACHIITVEDPIEYVHSNKLSVVEQREVHADTLSFSNALKYVLRQNPDVILVGEMRDTETIASALTAAETGHLVLATLHTNDAPQSVDRIVDSFPPHQQNQIRIQLAATLLGIVSQRLFPRKDGKGRIAAFELMVGSSGIRAIVREGKTHLLKSSIETGGKLGMITMEKAITELYHKNLISREEMASMITPEKEI